MANFLNISVWIREFGSSGNPNVGIDYILNTDYFLQNCYSTTTVRLYLDTSTTI
jgi:hypothetical protein